MAKKNKVATPPPPRNKTNLIKEENEFALYGLLLLFLAFIFFGSSYKVTGDDDFFWHLATGRYIIENGYVPDKDVFSFTADGTEWIPFEWAWDVLTYGLYNLGGYDLILVFRSIMFCLIFFIYFMLLKKFGVSTPISIIVLVLLFFSIIDRLSPRPHIFTYLFFTLLLYIMLHYRYISRKRYNRFIYVLPLIFLIWCNIHMGVIAGGLLLFVFVLAEVITYLKPGIFRGDEVQPISKAELLKLMIVSAVCALVLLINPNGLNTYLYAYSHTKLQLLENVNEWRSPFTDKLDFGFIVTLYKVYLVLGIITLLYAFRKKDVFFMLVVLVFAVYSLRAIRFTVDYEIIVTFFAAVSLSFFVKSILKRSVKSLNFLNGNFIKTALAVLLIYIITQYPSNNVYRSLNYYRFFGWGINEEYVPVKLFEFIKQNGITGKPYNHFGTGGYLIWNTDGEKNFIDSRNLSDGVFNEYNSIMHMKPGFEKKLEDNQIDYFVYLDPDLTSRTEILDNIIVNYFSRKSEWKLVYWDDISMLFVKDIPKFAEVISKYEYKVMHPYTALFHKVEFANNIITNSDMAKNEIERKQLTEPNGLLFEALNHVAAKTLGKGN